MNKSILLLLFLVQSFPSVTAEELFPFSIECNLRNSDIIIQAEIVDYNGKLKVEKYYKRALVDLEYIHIDQFAIDTTQQIEIGFPKAVGRKIILFIDLKEENPEFLPAYLGWRTSTLWLEDEMYLGVFQYSNPGDYILYPYFKDEDEFNVKVDHWIFLENLLIDSQQIEPTQSRIQYLVELFYWHPFKEDILGRLFQEEGLELKTVENLIWKICELRFLSKSDIYPCFLMEFETSNFYQQAFSLFKQTAGSQYDRQMKKFMKTPNSYLLYVEGRSSSNFPETFIIELTKFLNKTPIQNWENEKIEIKNNLDRKEEFLNDIFLKSLRRELN